MPAYGVEAYIEQAIRRIQAQTESDWEIIVVDDCAKDRSGEIADREAQKDERIRVLHAVSRHHDAKIRFSGHIADFSFYFSKSPAIIRSIFR